MVTAASWPNRLDYRQQVPVIKQRPSCIRKSTALEVPKQEVLMHNTDACPCTYDIDIAQDGQDGQADKDISTSTGRMLS